MKSNKPILAASITLIIATLSEIFNIIGDNKLWITIVFITALSITDIVYMYDRVTYSREQDTISSVYVTVLGISCIGNIICRMLIGTTFKSPLGFLSNFCVIFLLMLNTKYRIEDYFSSPKEIIMANPTKRIKPDVIPGDLCVVDINNLNRLKDYDGLYFCIAVERTGTYVKRGLFGKRYNVWNCLDPASETMHNVSERILFPVTKIPENEYDKLIVIRNPVNSPEIGDADINALNHAILAIESNSKENHKLILSLNKLRAKLTFYHSMRWNEK